MGGAQVAPFRRPCFDIGFDFKIAIVSYRGRSPTEESLLLDGDRRCFDFSGSHKDRMVTTSMTFHSVCVVTWFVEVIFALTTSEFYQDAISNSLNRNHEQS